MDKKLVNLAAHRGREARAERAGFWLCLLACAVVGHGTPRARGEEPPEEGIVLTDVTEAMGLNFVHDAGIENGFFMPEIMGSGVALFDCDGDLDLDLYLVNGGPRSGKPRSVENVNRLFRQDNGRFVDVTATSGLGDQGYGMGVAIGDIDNDGDEDVYVTNYGMDALYRNDGACRFTNVSEAAGIDNSAWATSAAFFDFDNDGLLDLYVVNFLAYDADLDCRGGTGERIYCGPSAFAGVPDRLYRNLGGCRFADVSAQAGIDKTSGKGLGVVAIDLTADGRTDVFVANDGEPNTLWVNQGDGRFVDEALIRGVALNEFGDTEASMGVAVGDVNGDNHLDLFVTHLSDETNTLYLSLGEFMEDSTTRAGLGMPSRTYTSFGALLVDLDHDSDLDIVLVNGEVGSGKLGGGRRSFRERYGQRNQVFENLGETSFREVLGDSTLATEVSRGLAAGDIDGDGDLDLVVTNVEGQARIFRNDSGAQHGVIRVRPVDPQLKRTVLGAMVEISLAGRRMSAPVIAARSYLSSSEAVASFGIGEHPRAEKLVVRWPGGVRESFGPVLAGHAVTALRGTGRTKVRQLVARTSHGVPPSAAAKAVIANQLPFSGTVHDALHDPLEGAEPQVVALFRAARSMIQADPEAVRHWGRLGMLYHAHNRAEHALACYARAVELDANDWRWPYLGGVILDRTRPALAVGSLEEALKLEPALAPALIRRGRALRALGRNKAAAESYRRALKLESQQAAAHLGLGQLALLAGNHTAGLDHLRRAVALAPYSALARVELSGLLGRIGDDVGARREATIAKQLDANFDILTDPLMVSVQGMSFSVGAVLNRAAKLRLRGKSKAALEELNRLIASAAPSAVVFNNRAILHLEHGALEAGLADIEEAIKLDPTNADLFVTRAAVKLRTGEAEGAAADLDAALSHDATHAHARIMRSQIHHRAGRRHDALADLDEVLRFDPRSVPALVRRARLFFDLNQLDKATADLKLAFELSPNDPEVRTLAVRYRNLLGS